MHGGDSRLTSFDRTLLGNCIFYISQLYEFSHRLGQTRPSPPEATRPFMYAMSPIATGSVHHNELSRCAKMYGYPRASETR
jgi:hypothetical protein